MSEALRKALLNYRVFLVDTEPDTPPSGAIRATHKGQGVDMPIVVIEVDRKDLPGLWVKEEIDRLLVKIKRIAKHKASNHPYELIGVGYDAFWGSCGIVYKNVRGEIFFRPWIGSHGFVDRFEWYTPRRR